jgi:hypothetical protein
MEHLRAGLLQSSLPGEGYRQVWPRSSMISSLRCPLNCEKDTNTLAALLFYQTFLSNYLT